MTMLKKSNGNFPARRWLSDFFDTDRFFRNDFAPEEWMPAVNVKDSEKQYDVEIAVPGYAKEDFSVKVDNGMLNVSAEVKEEHKQEEKDYTRHEFSYSSFNRNFSLPEDASESDIQAKYTDGVLRIVIPKKKAAERKSEKQIKIS